jgi:hypothetical protein
MQCLDDYVSKNVLHPPLLEQSPRSHHDDGLSNRAAHGPRIGLARQTMVRSTTTTTTKETRSLPTKAIIKKKKTKTAANTLL